MLRKIYQNNKPTHKLPGNDSNPLPYVAYEHESIFGKAVDQLVQDISHSCYLSRRYENTNSHTLKTMVREGLGLAWLPKSIVQLDFESGQLCRAGDEHWDIDFDVKLFHHHDVNSSPETEILKTSVEMSEIIN